MNAHQFPYGNICHALGEQAADVLNLFIGQFAGRVFHPLMRFAPAKFVAFIVCLCPGIQMRRIAAHGVIATMADKHPLRLGPSGKDVGHP